MEYRCRADDEQLCVYGKMMTGYFPRQVFFPFCVCFVPPLRYVLGRKSVPESISGWVCAILRVNYYRNYKLRLMFISECKPGLMFGGQSGVRCTPRCNYTETQSMKEKKNDRIRARAVMRTEGKQHSTSEASMTVCP